MNPMEIDYKNLLTRYIGYIKSIEGSDYILIHTEDEGLHFTPEDWDELVRMAVELEEK